MSDDQEKIKALINQLGQHLRDAREVYARLLQEHRVYCNFYHGPSKMQTYLPEEFIPKRTTTETFTT